jgi:hypothetical protein
MRCLLLIFPFQRSADADGRRLTIALQSQQNTAICPWTCGRHHGKFANPDQMPKYLKSQDFTQEWVWTGSPSLPYIDGKLGAVIN